MRNKLEYVDFTVRGSGPFPTDMLRYDECWPVGAEDANALSGSIDVLASRTEIKMRAVQCGGETRPTAKRWESFGWKVLS